MKNLPQSPGSYVLPILPHNERSEIFLQEPACFLMRIPQNYLSGLELQPELQRWENLRLRWPFVISWSVSSSSLFAEMLQNLLPSS